MVWQDLLFLLIPLSTALSPEPRDRELMRRLRNRDGDAATELYDRYAAPVFSIIVRVVRNREVAEELLQETFLRVWNRLQFFDPERGALGAWVLAVARNQAIDYLRSVSGRNWRNETAIHPLDEPSHFVDLGNELVQVEEAKRLRTAMEKLSANQRSVIDLAYFEGLSQSEMAERLSQPLGTIKTWVRAALRALREELGEVTVA